VLPALLVALAGCAGGASSSDAGVPGDTAVPVDVVVDAPPDLAEAAVRSDATPDLAEAAVLVDAPDDRGGTDARPPADATTLDAAALDTTALDATPDLACTPAPDQHGFYASCAACPSPGDCDTIDINGSRRYACGCSGGCPCGLHCGSYTVPGLPIVISGICVH
jgi:hypothetical protein